MDYLSLNQFSMTLYFEGESKLVNSEIILIFMVEIIDILSKFWIITVILSRVVECMFDKHPSLEPPWEEDMWQTRHNDHTWICAEHIETLSPSFCSLNLNICLTKLIVWDQISMGAENIINGYFPRQDRKKLTFFPYHLLRVLFYSRLKQSLLCRPYWNGPCHMKRKNIHPNRGHKSKPSNCAQSHSNCSGRNFFD